MSKANGFDRMDVATDLLNDPKFRRLARIAPDAVGGCVTLYVGLLADSWRQAERMTIEDAWPSVLPYDATYAELLKGVRLIDPDGRIPVKVWQEWFVEVLKRREASRERWNRANQKRHRDATARSPR